MHPEITRIQKMLGDQGYVADREIATAIYLSMTLRKPLLIEGAAGVGKTEVAKVMARALDTELIRLQCYEGLDATTALYEWNYQKQLLHIRLTERSDRTVEEREHEIFGKEFLLERPLLESITRERSPVLLIDEVDRCIPLNAIVATPSGHVYAGSIREGDEVISFNPRTFLPGRSTVTRAIRRQAPHMLRLFVGGRIIECTPEHRFVRFKPEGYEVVRADEIQPGDQLPIQAPSAEPRIQGEEPVLSFGDAILKITPSGRSLLHRAYKTSGKTYEELARAVGVSRTHLRNVLQPRPFRASLRADVLTRLCAQLGVDANHFISECVRGIRGPNTSPAFYELLGYVVADGCVTADALLIVDKSVENLQIYAQKFAEAFGEFPRIRPGPHRNFELHVLSLPLRRFLSRVIDRGLRRSPYREVPEFIFRLPAEKQAAFVRGFFDGEGWVGDHQVSVVSSSAPLLVGVQALLGSLGIEGRISPLRVGAGTFGRREYYALVVSDVRAFAERVGFCAPEKQVRLAQLKTARRFAKSGYLPVGLVFPLLEELRVGATLHSIPHHQTIYDILSGRVKANVSSLARVVSSYPSLPLEALLEGGMVLGTVTRIDCLDRHEDVVDLTLSGQPYFVANQVVTHNCDVEFEAFLLEVLSDFQVSIPEIGTIRATSVPYVVLTSNRTRELGDALRRRCLYLWIDYPSFEKELSIVLAKVPAINAELAAQVAGFMQIVRRTRLDKVPGIAEAIDWAGALIALHRDHLDREAVEETLGVLFKSQDDARTARTQWLDGWIAALERLRAEPLPWSQNVLERVAAQVDGGHQTPAPSKGVTGRR